MSSLLRQKEDFSKRNTRTIAGIVTATGFEEQPDLCGHCTIAAPQGIPTARLKWHRHRQSISPVSFWSVSKKRASSKFLGDCKGHRASSGLVALAGN